MANSPLTQPPESLGIEHVESTPKSSQTRKFTKSFLPNPAPDHLKWLAERIRKARGKDSLAAVAKRCGTPVDQLKGLEDGVFSLCVGELKHILDRGYQLSFNELLVDFCAQHPELNPQEHPLKRKAYYRVRFKDYSQEHQDAPTRFFVAGDPGTLRWAIPLRTFHKDLGQTMSTDLLELPKGGFTKRKPHRGEELVHVIFGKKILVNFPGRDYAARLYHGDTVHLRSDHDHYITNEGNTRALLLIVRAPAPRRSNTPRKAVTSRKKH